MNKPVYLGPSTLELSKILMYEFWNDYVKRKYGKKTKLLYGYRQFHCIQEKDDIYKDIAEVAKTRFDTSNYDLDRPLSKGKHEKVID